ncbi:MAG: tRNA (adenosine(37)-N6)-threonylcarbamoyltransferase complex dimerization subunit type 1 TsaB [Candidatus Omnitrophota bacterium]
MKILACDTSTKILSVAILDNDTVLKKYHYGEEGGSDYLFVVIDKFLKALKIKLADFDLFGVGTGPGSFTGLRISTCAFKTFAFCANKPLCGISSFDAIAYNFKNAGMPVCVAEDAKKNKIYAAFYDLDKKGVLQTRRKCALFTVEDLLKKIKGPLVIAGGAIERYKEVFLSVKNKDLSLAEEELWYPRAEIIGQLAKENFSRGENDDVFDLAPVYLHSEKANITKPKKLK